MKLRLRSHYPAKKTVVVNLESEDVVLTLGHLQTEAGNHFTFPDPGQFYLSLNGTDKLDGTEDTPLSQLGVISGDLILVLPQQECLAAPTRDGIKLETSNAQPPDGQSHKKESPSTSFSSEDTKLPAPTQNTNTDISEAMNVSRQEKTLEETYPENQQEDMDNDAEVNKYLRQPMFLRDATEDSIPDTVHTSLSEAAPRNPAETLSVLLHVLMTESGFQHVCSAAAASDVSPGFPSSWRQSGSIRFAYTHPSCGDARFDLVCVSMGMLLVIHGSIKGSPSSEICQLTLKPEEFVVVSNAIDNIYRFVSLARLSRKFKDRVSHALIQDSQQEDLGPIPTLISLTYEVKLQILKNLDVASLLRLSETCSTFLGLSRENVLWRRLYMKDYGRRPDKQTGPTQEWRKLYKDKYIFKKKMREQMRLMTTVTPSFLHQSYPMAPFQPYQPPFMIGGDYDRGLVFPNALDPRAGIRPGAMLPRPRFDPIGPLPDNPLHQPGRGGGLWDAGPGRPGNSRLGGMGRFF